MRALQRDPGADFASAEILNAWRSKCAAKLYSLTPS